MRLGWHQSSAALHVLASLLILDASPLGSARPVSVQDGSGPLLGAEVSFLPSHDITAATSATKGAAASEQLLLPSSPYFSLRHEQCN